ncbi:SRPBCC domain-containing protein [Leifsonia kafniensis]|uniref:SRPBCC domain-containing protein n=1 Tax=Leifsonia kafniensis TaxID=475957 RepID=A0ABP7K429_9MICO
MNDDTPVVPRLRDEDLAASRRGTTQIYRIEIAVSPERIWEAITDPDWTARYGYGGRAVVEPRVGGRYFVEKPPHLRVVAGDGTVPAPDIIIEGVVTAYDPPSLLATKMRFLVDPESADEPATEVRYAIKRLGDGRSRLTVTHDLLGAPHLAAVVSGDFERLGAGGGHPYMLRDLKSLLETGRSLREQIGSGSGDVNL